MNEQIKVPENYTYDEWANLSFFGNYTDYCYYIDELKEFLIEFQKYIEVTNIQLASDRITSHDSEHLEQMKHSFEHSHGSILRESSIISLYIQLERSIDGFCNNFKKFSGSKIGLSDFRGDILDRFKKYSVKVMDLGYDFSSSQWQYIVGLHEIRNCLVHNSGVVEGYNKRAVIDSFIKLQKSISLYDNYSLEITFEGCMTAISMVEEFLKTLTSLAFKKFPGRYG